MRSLGLVACLAISGCMSIPVSTMVRMATFDETDFLELQPAQLRIRITSDSDAPLILRKTRLNLEMLGRDGGRAPMNGAVVLESEEDLTPEKTFWPFAYKPEHVYVLKLDEDAIASYQHLQERIKRRELRAVLTNGVDYDFKGQEEAQITVELKLASAEDYFTLLDKARFPPEDLPADAQ